jgi:DNA polymerase-3 subunit delta
MADAPIVYVLHGDDEFAIADFVSGMEAKLGDPAAASMNITCLEGHATSIDALVSNTHAMPFLTNRRLVVLTDPLGRMNSPASRDKFKSTLETIPPTTALALVIHRPLVDPRDKRKGIQHWLQVWAASQEGRVYIREFSLPQGSQMVHWIQNKAVDLGGTFSSQAAAQLAEYVLGDPRLAAQEIEKLLAYVNYKRPVDPDDVGRLTPYAGEGNVFEMVDALGNRNGPLALRMLHRLLEEDEPLRLFGMIVRQFRLLLLTRELLDVGNREAEIAKQLKTFPFVARKLIGQVRHFSLTSLEEIYHKLLEVDAAIKTGQVSSEVVLDTLITSLTT